MYTIFVDLSFWEIFPISIIKCVFWEYLILIRIILFLRANSNLKTRKQLPKYILFEIYPIKFIFVPSVRSFIAFLVQFGVKLCANIQHLFEPSAAICWYIILVSKFTHEDETFWKCQFENLNSLKVISMKNHNRVDNF